MSERFSVTPHGRLLFARSFPGLAAIAFALCGWPVAAGVSLVVASMGDLLVGSWATRHGRPAAESDVQLEGFVDFVCFVWAPVQFANAVGKPGAFVLGASGLFVLAGAYRLARFNIEGTFDGGYRGLPVTYAGAGVPLATLAAALTGVASPTAGAAAALATMAILMPSSRFTTPRLSL